MNNTPKGNRLHIGIFGIANAGKSTLLNFLTGQETSIISKKAGTTTDPVYKPMEIPSLGPVTFIDTAGFDDNTSLGKIRTEKTKGVIEKCDAALFVLSEDRSITNNNVETTESSNAKNRKAVVNHIDSSKSLNLEYPNSQLTWLNYLKSKNIPIITIYMKKDDSYLNSLSNTFHNGNLDTEAYDNKQIEKAVDDKTLSKPNINKYLLQPTKKVYAINTADLVEIDIKNLKTRDELLEKIVEKTKSIKENSRSITANLVNKGDIIILVMPQDKSAPTGRLILPQVQTIREILDKGAIPICTTLETLEQSLKNLNTKPDLVITDSQVFHQVSKILLSNIKLTSFSILFASQKGDIQYFIESVKVLDTLNESSKVLILEACTHPPSDEDIGTVKIPKLIRAKYGNIHFDFGRGDKLPDLTKYDLIIQCGSCMFNRKQVINRVEKAKALKIPMTNYGITIAYLKGILDKVTIPK